MIKIFILLFGTCSYLFAQGQADPVPVSCPDGLATSYTLTSGVWTGNQVPPYGANIPPTNYGKIYPNGTGNPSCSLIKTGVCSWGGNNGGGENYFGSTLRLVASGAGSPFWEITCYFTIWVNEPSGYQFLDASRIFRKTTGSTPAGVYTRQDGGQAQTMTVSPGNTGGPDRKPECHDHTGVGTFDAFTGNMHREIKDLEVWGGVGEPLVWMRYGNSRIGTSSLNYGNAHNWNNSYQYSMRDNGVYYSTGKPQILIHYPEGGQDNFIQDNAQTNLYVPQGGVDKRLFQYGSDFYLQTGNGYRYHFKKSGSDYQLQDFRDTYQHLYKLFYTTDKLLDSIAEPGGRYLKVSYITIKTDIKVISQVRTKDGRSVQYHYAIVSDSTLGVRLDSVKYGDGTNALYTYSQVAPGWQPNLQHAIDPRFEGAAVNMQYTYSTDYPPGFIKEEKNGVTGEVMVTLSSDTANRIVCYSNGRTQKLNVPGALLGNTSQYTDGAGSNTQYTYNQAGIGFVTGSRDGLNRLTTYDSITKYGNTIKITYPDGIKERWTRDTLDLVLTHTDRLGRVTTYTRPDSSRRVTRIDYPDNTYETFSYNNFGQVLDHRMKNGALDHSVYGPTGLKTSFKDILGDTTSFAYDLSDRLASITDARGNKTQFEYNERGQLTKQINADLSFKKYDYDNLGNQIKTTDELAHAWTTVYDEFRRPKTVTDPLNRTTTYSYDLPGGVCGCTHDNNTPTKITLPSGKATRIEYDVEWRKIRETTGAGTADEASIFYQYDLIGNMVKVVDPKGKQWLSAYDSLNRKKNSTDPLGNKTQWVYDSVGNVLKVIRPDNGSTVNAYDSMNRLKQITDPKGQTTKMFYDAEGNLIKMTDPNNHDYQFQYDLLNRKTKMIYPDNSFEQYTYDSVSNLKTYTTRANEVRSYTYDNRNREVNSAWSDITPAITRTYDNASRLLTMISNVSALTYTYDNANQLISETQNVTGSGSSKTITHHYNVDGLRDTMTYPDGSGLRYTYTTRNQLATISINEVSPLASYTYDVNGNRINKALNNGTSTAYTYDDANRILMLDNLKAGISFSKFDYGYDSVSRRKYVKRDNDKGDVYSYDATDQVTDVKYDATAPEGIPVSPGRTVNYIWDSVGNRKVVTDNGMSINYTPNNLNEYTSVGANVLTNTTNGNLRTFDGWTYSYDAQNRLTQAVKGSIVGSFSYDPMNRCVKRIINGTTFFFYYDAWNLIDERNGNVEIARYIHGARIDEILTKNSF